MNLVVRLFLRVFLPLVGKPKGGGHWVTPWGFPTKGKKTRKNKRTTKFIMVSRHDRKKKQQ